MTKDGPIKTAFDRLPDGVIRQELVTYYMRDNQLVKETVERKYSSNGDYHDSTIVVPLT